MIEKNKVMMVLNLNEKIIPCIVRKDKAEEVRVVVKTLCNEYEKDAPPMRLEDYITNALDSIFFEDECQRINTVKGVTRTVVI